MNQHFFITIEGSEGVGKTTAVKFIEKFLIERNYPHLLTREPGGTPIAEKIRDILLHTDNENLAPETELLLMFASRVQHVETVIKPALSQKKIVVCDRFIDATYAYQGGGRCLSIASIEALEALTLQGFLPGLTLLLDAPLDICFERMQQRAKKFDRFETQSREFFERVRQVYLERAYKFPERFKMIDTSGDIESVNEQLLLTLNAYCEKFQ
jgi:dTMP kinase